MSGKPSKVEVGQRWRISDNLVGEILRSGSPCLTRWTAPDGRKWETVGWSDNHFLAQATYLGGPSTAPIAPPVPAVGQRWRGLDKPFWIGQTIVVREVLHGLVRYDYEDGTMGFRREVEKFAPELVRFIGWADGYGPRAPVPSPG